MENIRIIYLCNAVDEETKNIRHIQFNNAAATNKVFGLVKALQTQGTDVHVVSLGRGKQTGSKERFSIQHKSIFGFSIHYAAFWHIPIFTHLVGALSLASLVQHLIHGYQGKVIVIAYNRLWHYLPALFFLKLHGSKGYLDLEDGNLPARNILGKIIDWVRRILFEYLCHDGALLAAKSLTSQVKTNNTFVCYGCTGLLAKDENKWVQKPILILFGGSLLFETGVQLLIETITILESQCPELKQKIKFIITGYGSMLTDLSHFSESSGKDWIDFLGDVDREQYLELLKESHIGLCLKLSSSEMGKTTFPSKIIEYASHGLAIISTKVSDVPDLLDNDSAILLDEDTPQYLASIFQKIGDGSIDLQSLGKKGQDKVNSVCNIETVGINLKTFLLKEND
ncbi:MAG: hypothetical protein C0410_08180 [Anaerolinea sp.]|nr:hypothetical protein [Anaerolinea sp.]